MNKAQYGSTKALSEMIRAARGDIPADLVIRGARWLDVYSGEFREGDVAVREGTIVGVMDHYEAKTVVEAKGAYVVPGFIDAHVHVESSLMTPARFQQAVLPHGTTSVIWDPHEITNVKGVAGIQWALEASDGLDLDLFVMIPSCVPSTSPEAGLETSGAVLTAKDLAAFRGHPRVLGLAEMMNFPGLLGGDPDVLAKLVDFGGLRRDGHCPGLLGKDLNAYGVAGIHSCHESTTLPEAREKMAKGVQVLVREGSCAKDADQLLPLLNAYTSANLSLCSDDRNPADIEAEGHISCIINKALRSGHRPEDIFRAASYAPARLFGLDDRGAVAPGLKADFVLVEPQNGSLWTAGMRVRATYKNGRRVDSQDLRRVADRRAGGFAVKNLHLDLAAPPTFKVAVPSPAKAARQPVHVIGVIPRQILTEPLQETLAVQNGGILADPGKDVLKIAVLERHHGSGGRGVGFVKGFGLKRGAIATSINHDSHNVITVGSTDELMAQAVNRLIAIDGGIVVVDDRGTVAELPLPIGGLMTNADPAEVTAALHKLKALAAAIGCGLEEPFLQLSFLALPVIPTLKITDKGLVDVREFRLVPVALGN